MCSEKERRIFIKAMEIDTNHDNDLDIEFPVKDRVTTRKHSDSKRKAKQKDRGRKAVAYQRSCDLYNAGIDYKGITFKRRAMSQFADMDEKEYNKAY